MNATTPQTRTHSAHPPLRSSAAPKPRGQRYVGTMKDQEIFRAEVRLLQAECSKPDDVRTAKAILCAVFGSNLNIDALFHELRDRMDRERAWDLNFPISLFGFYLAERRGKFLHVMPNGETVNARLTRVSGQGGEFLRMIDEQGHPVPGRQDVLISQGNATRLRKLYEKRRIREIPLALPGLEAQ